MTKYLHSKILDLPLKYDTETGILTVKELKKYGSKGYVTYSANELKILQENGGVTKNVQMVKNIFEGEIVI